MADIKWSAFPTIGALATGDTLVGLRAGANVKFSSLTVPWTLANGGTNAALTASNGGIFYSTATAGAILAGTATAGKMLQSGSTAAPTWSTSTYPATNAVNTLLYASSANVMGALATANNGILVTSAGGVPSIGNAILADITINGLKAGVGAGAGARSTAFGLIALGNGTGADNTGFGRQAGSSLTSGTDNTFGGSTTGYQITSGSEHTAFGSNALGGVLTTNGNSAFGYFALNAATGGTNVGVGRSAMRWITTGTGNVGIGANVGGNLNVGTRIDSGSGNILIGPEASADNIAASNTIAIGRQAVSAIATGATSADAGPGIAIGSSGFKVGFRGDGSIWPSTTGAGFWRPVINGTAYMVPLIASGATAWPAITTASIAFSTTSGIIGTTTNNNAAAGSVGETINSIVDGSTPFSLSTTTQQNVTSISLTAGDWDVWGNITLQHGAGTTVNFTLAWIDTASATIPNAAYYNSLFLNNAVLATNPGVIIPSRRFLLSATTTIYMSTYCDFAVSTLTACGGVYARRRR